MRMLPGGEFLVCWKEDEEDQPVKGQAYDAAGGPLGSPFIVFDTDGVTSGPHLAGTPLAHAVAAWSNGYIAVTKYREPVNILTEEITYSVFYRRIRPNGTLDGDPVLVSNPNFDWSGSTQAANPIDIAVSLSGAFVIAWEDEVDDSDVLDNRRLRFFGADGQPVSGVVRPPSRGPEAACYSQQVAMDGNGRTYLVASMNYPDSVAIGVDVFSPLGVWLGSNIVAEAPISTSDLGYGDVAATGTNGFVATWTRVDRFDGPDNSDVYAGQFSAAGTPLADAFCVHAVTNGWQSGSRVAADADGNYVVKWSDWEPLRKIMGYASRENPNRHWKFEGGAWHSSNSWVEGTAPTQTNPVFFTQVSSNHTDLVNVTNPVTVEQMTVDGTHVTLALDGHECRFDRVPDTGCSLDVGLDPAKPASLRVINGSPGGGIDFGAGPGVGAPSRMRIGPSGRLLLEFADLWIRDDATMAVDGGGMLQVNGCELQNDGSITLEPDSTLVLTNGATLIHGNDAKFTGAGRMEGFMSSIVIHSLLTVPRETKLALTTIEDDDEGDPQVVFIGTNSAVSMDAAGIECDLVVAGRLETVGFGYVAAEGSIVEDTGEMLAAPNLLLSGDFLNGGLLHTTNPPAFDPSDGLKHGPGFFVNASGAVVRVVDTPCTLQSTDIDNQGTIEVSGRYGMRVKNFNNFTNSGTLRCVEARNYIGVVGEGGGGWFGNVGTLVLETGELWMADIDMIENAGRMEIQGGEWTVLAFDSFANWADIVIASNAAAYIYGTEFTNDPGATITGRGLIETGTDAFYLPPECEPDLVVEEGACVAVREHELSGIVHVRPDGAILVWGDNTRADRAGATLRVTHPDGLRNEGTVTLTGEGGGPYTNNVRLLLTEGTLRNETNGTIRMHGLGGGWRSIAAPVHNRGTVVCTVPDSTLSMPGRSFTNEGTIALGTAGVLEIAAAEIVNATNGLLFGSGELQVQGSAFLNHGSLEPRNLNSTTQVSRLTIGGDLEHNATGVIDVRLISSNEWLTCDELATTGEAHLEGKLNLTVPTGSTLGEGDTFRVLTYRSRYGTFGEVTHPPEIDDPTLYYMPEALWLSYGALQEDVLEGLLYVPDSVGRDGRLSWEGRLRKEGAGRLTLDVGGESVGVAEASELSVGEGTVVLTGGLDPLNDGTNGVAVEMDGGRLEIQTDVTAGGLYGTGVVLVDGASLSVDLPEGETNLFAGDISGSGGFEKRGPGRLVLSGTVVLTGTVDVAEGVLQVDGELRCSGGLSVAVGATLSGSGRIVTPVQLAPHASLRPGSSPGILTVAGTVAVHSNSVLHIGVPWDGEGVPVAGVDYAQLVVEGGIDLGGMEVELAILDDGFASGATGTAFRVVDARSPMSGEFSCGASLVADGHLFAVDYGGVDGTDVALILELGPATDSDGDGVPDLFEQACGTDPDDPGSGSEALPRVISPAPDSVVIVFRMLEDPGSLRYEVRSSDDLELDIGQWRVEALPAVPSDPQPPGMPSGVRQVEVTVPVEGEQPRFLRLVVVGF